MIESQSIDCRLDTLGCFCSNAVVLEKSKHLHSPELTPHPSRDIDRQRLLHTPASVSLSCFSSFVGILQFIDRIRTLGTLSDFSGQIERCD